jgi:hypothetical protein
MEGMVMMTAERFGRPADFSTKPALRPCHNSFMSIRNRRDYEKLRAIGLIVREVLDRTAAAVRPGITTGELDYIGARVLAGHGAESSPPKVYGFPGALCISVNDEAIHGIPGDRVVQAGDLVKLDLVAEKDGYLADAAVTVTAGEASATAAALVRCAESAFHLAAREARAGTASTTSAAPWSVRRTAAASAYCAASAATAWGAPSMKPPAFRIITIRAAASVSTKAWSSPSSRSSR